MATRCGAAACIVVDACSGEANIYVRTAAVSVAEKGISAMAQDCHGGHACIGLVGKGMCTEQGI